MPAASEDGPAAAPRRIQSIDIGFRLVRVIEAAGVGLSLKEVAGRAQMPRSKAHLYLATFLGIGLLARDTAGRYALGPYALQLGLAALRQSNVVDIADEALRTLQSATGHSVHLSIWGNLGPTIVRKLDGNIQAPMSVRVGYVLPLLSSATGRIFLAYQTEALTRPLLHKELGEPAMHGRGEVTLTEHSRAALVDSVRASGFSSTEGRLHEGYAALSAPVFDHRGDLCAAITVLDSSARVDLDPAHQTGRLLRDAADEIAARLGRA